MTRYGKLQTFTSFRRKGRKYWHCICDCGGSKDVYEWSLKSGRTKSCGCIKRGQSVEQCEKRKIPENGSAANEIIYKYRLRCKKNGISWELTRDDCIKLFKGNCRYCGARPERARRVHTSVFIYNGIDRVNNSVGYTKENVASCCMRCNYMKSDLTLEEFYEHISKIWKRKESR